MVAAVTPTVSHSCPRTEVFLALLSTVLLQYLPWPSIPALGALRL